MSDIVERLHALEAWIRKPTGEAFNMNTDLFDDAADLITALRAENERLRVGLWDIHAYCNNWDWFIWMWPIRRIKRIARAALEEK